MDVRATDIVEEIQECLTDTPNAPAVKRILAELQRMAVQLSDNEKSAEFHNTLRGFVRVWGDMFSPSEEKISPLLDALFSLHGYPEDRSRPK